MISQIVLILTKICTSIFEACIIFRTLKCFTWLIPENYCYLILLTGANTKLPLVFSTCKCSAALANLNHPFSKRTSSLSHFSVSCQLPTLLCMTFNSACLTTFFWFWWLTYENTKLQNNYLPCPIYCGFWTNLWCKNKDKKYKWP